MTSIEEWGNKARDLDELDVGYRAPPNATGDMKAEEVRLELTPDRLDIRDALVLEILNHWRSFEWTVQGFGMARTKLAGVGRIHVWDSRLRAPLVSDVHAHPWDLTSRVVSGELLNQRFIIADAVDVIPMHYVQQVIATGEGGGLRGEPEDVQLCSCTPELYLPGQTYHQAASEIHRSIAQDGTVTLMERTQGAPLQETLVFWPKGMQWVSAEPVPAPEWPLSQAIALAIQRWRPRAET